MSAPPLMDAFDDCLTRVRAGEALDDCLQRYPALEGDLRPMLEAAQLARAVGRVPHHVQMRSRARFLTAAAQLRQPERRARGRGAGLLRRAFSTVLAVLVGFILGTTGIYYASADSLPGQRLYGLKRTFEGGRIQLAADIADRYVLEQTFQQRRRDEVEVVLSDPRSQGVVVNFDGALQAATEGFWLVDGIPVELRSVTRIEGGPRVGFHVAVVAESRAGSLYALDLSVDEIEVDGELQRQGDEWLIDGVPFALTADTRVTGSLQSGARAMVRLLALDSGGQVATVVQVEKPRATVTSTPAPTPTALPSPSPDSTASPTPQLTETPAVTEPAAPQPTSGEDEDSVDTSGVETATPGGDDNGGKQEQADDAASGDQYSGSGGGDDSSSSSGDGSGEDASGGGGNSGSGGGSDGDHSGSGSGGSGGSGSGSDGGGENDDNSGKGGGNDDDSGDNPDDNGSD